MHSCSLIASMSSRLFDQVVCKNSWIGGRKSQRLYLRSQGGQEYVLESCIVEGNIRVTPIASSCLITPHNENEFWTQNINLQLNWDRVPEFRRRLWFAIGARVPIILPNYTNNHTKRSYIFIFTRSIGAVMSNKGNKNETSFDFLSPSTPSFWFIASKLKDMLTSNQDVSESKIKQSGG